MIILNNITKSYKIKKQSTKIVLEDINITLPNQGMIMIVGKSGSGKSTLLNIIGTLDKPNSGEIIIDNHNVLKLNNKQLNNYRNTYLGFIFQEYNLLDNLNVLENIKLSLDLQKKRISNHEILELLNNLDLKDLEKRKTNELSGGEKQRVALARAIIKDKKILLADEPTGNLDSKNSEDVFKILKEISKNHLVIVVTHNLDYAKLYGDRIIELSEGKIINDSNPVKDENTKEILKLKKANLSFLKMCHLAFKNIQKKKMRLILTSLFISVSLILYSISFNLKKFDIIETHANTLIEEKENLIKINKNISNSDYFALTNFYKEEYNEVVNKLPKDSLIITENFIIENNKINEFVFANKLEEETAYYSLNDFGESKILVTPNEIMKKIDILGKMPDFPQEVIINQLQADYLIANGIYKYIENESKEIKEEDRIYKPNSYEEILNDKMKVHFGSSYFVISGIKKINLEKFNSLKEITLNEAKVKEKDLLNEFYIKYNNVMNELIVSEEFVNKGIFEANIQLDNNLFETKSTFLGNETYESFYYYGLTKEIDVITKEGNKTINSLESNEIILNKYTIEKMVPNYDFVGYYQDLLTNYNQKKSERDKLIQNELDKAALDENYIMQEIPEIIPPNYIEETDKYLYKILKDYKILGSDFEITINDSNNLLKDKKEKTLKLKVVGININLEEGNNYILLENIKPYMRDNVEINRVNIYETDKNQIKNILKEFPLTKNKYTSSTIYSDSVIEMSKIINSTEKIAYYTTFVFLILTILLFTNYIVNSIKLNQKNIGILRSLGTKKVDIFNIFLLESIIIGLISFGISMSMCSLFVDQANLFISRDLYADMKPIMFDENVIIYTIILLVIIIFISSLIPILKIVNQKPIEAINQK